MNKYLEWAKSALILALLAWAIWALFFKPAHAHDYRSNGEPVPLWVKSWCCGPQDVHRIKPSAVHIMADGFHIDGLKVVIPMSRAIPSPDGNYWGFWNPVNEPDPVVFCFFAPLNGADNAEVQTQVARQGD